MFNEKMAGLVGPSYFLAFMAGGITGMAQRTPLKARRTKRLFLNSVVNNTMKTGFRFANNTGAAVLLYLLTGKFIVFIFKEEFEDFDIKESGKNAVYGACAGAIYKSTRGFRPMMLSALLGATVGSAYGYAWQNGYLKLL